MDRIILFGLNEEDADMIRDCGVKCELSVFDVFEDVIAHYAELSIINPCALTEDERECLAGFYRDIDPCDERVIITDEDELFNGISFVEIIPDMFESVNTVSFHIMKQLKETKRDVNYSRRIMQAIKILFLIQRNPGITTKKLAEESEINERSVRRQIRSLQAAGMMIEYENKGWTSLMRPDELI